MIRFGTRAKRKNLIYTAAIAALATGAVFSGLMLSGFTGFLVSTESFYTSPGFEAGQSGEFAWSPEQQGFLTSVKLSGRIIGNGSVKVFLQAGDKRFLILDSSLLPGWNATAAGNESFASSNETANSLENMTANETAENLTAPTNMTANETIPQNVTEISNATGEIPAGNLVAPENATENTTAQLPEGNATGALNATANETAAVNETVVPVQELRFEDACIETCPLPELNESSYTLVFEIENGTALHIDSVRYSVLRYEVPEPANLPPSGQIPDQTVEAGHSLSINLSLYFLDPENETLSYAVDSPISDSFIDNDILTIKPSEEGNFTITVSASDSRSMVFSTFWLFVLPSNITELNLTNATEILPTILSCSGCPDCSEKLRSSPPGSTVLLDSDIASQPGNCIEFSGAVNITFNCQGHKITGPGSGCGISINSSRENLVKNCIIEGFYAGVYLDRNSNLNSIVAVTVSGNDYGVSLFSSTTNQLEGITGKIRVSSSSRNAIRC